MTCIYETNVFLPPEPGRDEIQAAAIFVETDPSVLDPLLYPAEFGQLMKNAMDRLQALCTPVTIRSFLESLEQCRGVRKAGLKAVMEDIDFTKAAKT